MADRFSKNNILAILREKVQAKGFNLNPDKSKMSKVAVTIADLLDVLASSLSEILSQEEIRNATIKASSLKLGPSGLQNAIATKDMAVKFDITTDPQFFTWIETLHGILQAVYPEAGYGAPNTFAMALKTLIGAKPSSLTGKINEGSGSVKVTI
jgi:hypothetical protein